MARPRSKPTRLRLALACCYLALGSVHSIAAFVLAWYAKGDAGAFLVSGILTAVWASVVATSRSVSMPDLSIFGKR